LGIPGGPPRGAGGWLIRARAMSNPKNREGRLSGQKPRDFFQWGGRGRLRARGGEKKKTRGGARRKTARKAVFGPGGGGRADRFGRGGASQGMGSFTGMGRGLWAGGGGPGPSKPSPAGRIPGQKINGLQPGAGLGLGSRDRLACPKRWQRGGGNPRGKGLPGLRCGFYAGARADRDDSGKGGGTGPAR